MKKLFVILTICILLIASLASCNNETVSLTECGESVISIMAEMIVSDGYKEFYEFSINESQNEIINKISKCDYSKASAVY